jgi:hypothetical protein
MQGVVLMAEDNVGEGGTFVSVINGLYDCTDNRVITVRYRDPKYAEGFIFPARKLSNATEPPKVLKQGIDQGNPHYRPVIGFNHNRSQFASVGEPGHRQVNHYTSNRYFDKSGGGGNGELAFDTVELLKLIFFVLQIVTILREIGRISIRTTVRASAISSKADLITTDSSKDVTTTLLHLLAIKTVTIISIVKTIRVELHHHQKQVVLMKDRKEIRQEAISSGKRSEVVSKAKGKEEDSNRLAGVINAIIQTLTSNSVIISLTRSLDLRIHDMVVVTRATRKLCEIKNKHVP